MHRNDYKFKLAEDFIRSIDIIIVLIIFIIIRDEKWNQPFHMDAFLSIEFSLWNFMEFSIIAFLWNRIFTLMHMYGRISERWISRIFRIFIASSLGAASIFLFEKIMNIKGFSIKSAFILWLALICVFILYRLFLFEVLRRIIPFRKQSHVVIIGRNSRSLSLIKKLKITRPDYHILGFIDNISEENNIWEYNSKSLPRLLCPLYEFGRYISNVPLLDEVIITLPMRSCYDEIGRIIKICSTHGVKTRLVNDLFDFNIDMDRNSSSAFIDYHFTGSYELQYDLKRLFDIMISLAGLFVLTPVFLITSLAIFIDDGLPVFFIREAVGLNKQRFKRIRFRSMIRGADQMQAALEELDKSDTFRIKDDINLTKIGRFLRKTGIEQIPQLFNVLSGSMSIVGPKPLSIKSSYKDIYSRRFSLRPGIIGYWQISGRNEIDFDEFISLDLQYIDKWNLLLDFKIILIKIYMICEKCYFCAYNKLPVESILECSDDDKKNDNRH